MDASVTSPYVTMGSGSGRLNPLEEGRTANEMESRCKHVN
jgi:hypothetical protein